MAKLRPVLEEELEHLATGAWILGTGGGGNPYLGLLNIKRLYAQGKTVSLIEPEDLDDDGLVAFAVNIGAPLIGQERLGDPAFAVKPVRMMEEYLGRGFQAVMSGEIGGANAIQPFLVAALTGLPVVNADGMGRAFPEGRMSSFAIKDRPMFPMALADIRDNEVILQRADGIKWMDKLARRITVEMGSIANFCRAHTGKEIKDCGILHTVTKAISLGQAVERARREHRDPIQAILDAENGILIFRGKLQDLERRPTGGFLRGAAMLQGLDDDVGHSFELLFQNEFIVGKLDGEPRITTPDLICVLDSVSGEAVGTEMLRYGQRLTVIALPAQPIQLTEKGLQHVGPRVFGYDLDFVSVFDEAPR